MATWKLRFPARQIPKLAYRYGYDGDVPIIEIGRRARAAGEYTFEEFLTVCDWKSKRTRSRCRKNTPTDVAAVTRIALSTPSEMLRIGVLRCLHGVDWPTASVLLHMAHRDPYPILDVRALWSLGVEKPGAYSFELWRKYVEVCRRLAKQHGIDMRTLDRALWQFSKDHQGKLR